jgi:integrase
LEKSYSQVVEEEAREQRRKTIQFAADEFLQDYRAKHQSPKYAEYALGHVSRHLGDSLVEEITPSVVKRYQADRLREKASPKTINDEVQLLLRLCGEQGVLIRATLRRDKALKLTLPPSPGRAYSADEKARMLEEAQKLRTPQMYAAFALDLNTGLRDKELRQIRWAQIDLVNKKALTVGKAKTAAGTGRIIPLNETALAALEAHAAWYTRRLGACRPEWFVFAFGAPLPKDLTRPITSFKTAWTTVREKAGVKGRWHDNRHTLVTELAESGAGDEVIMSIAGHVSRAMLSRYSHVRMEAKRRALDEIATRQRTADEKRKREIERQRLAEMVPQTLAIQ